jgi:uncharacterized protein
MSDVTITVRGEHETRLSPEQGVVHITLRAEGPERGPVVERVSALALPIREDLTARQQAGTIDEWSSQRVTVWSDRPWNADGARLSLVHYASVDVTATFSDFAALSWWVSEIADREGVQIGGVDWRLTPATRAAREQEVAAHAVQVAIARATAYAQAIGRTTVTPVEIADLGLLGRGESAPSPAAPKMMRSAFSAMDAAGSAPAMQFQPEDITLTAAVEARFTAS